jgi:hypothetical protein
MNMDNSNNNAVYDAVDLAKRIFDAIVPNKDSIVTTISKSKEKMFLAPDNIGTQVFGYFYDQVPDLLEEVMLAKEKWYWFAGKNKAPNYERIKSEALRKDKNGYKVPNVITKYAWEHGYLPKDEEVDLWLVKDRDAYTVTFLTTRRKLSRFINKYTNTVPVFDEKRGELFFLHQPPVIFEGSVRILTVKLLLDNLNSIVSLQELYDIPRPKVQNQEIVGHERKQSYEKYGKKEKPNDAVDDVCHKIREIIGKDVVLKETLRILHEKNVGYGLFVDNRSLLAYLST